MILSGTGGAELAAEALCNSMVPQVVYEIFKAIEKTYKHQRL